ncbi:hypothetical protein CMT41_14690 [Colwellia sp. MT41]|uniref:hypothetical protein n=1 Tax=Colwellia sp. MT41 TaxID=58049 RepID=UPI0007179D55|nr:hypothetical protein [Colwellia sp. MT41]ALO35828.1 hypothetical protein CMT41_14690 [Colwellia sp. MT41]
MKTLTLCLACVGLSLLTACQSTSKDLMTKNAEVNQQTQYFVEAKISLDKLKQDISQGRKEQLAYFAPSTFKKAVAEFDNATEVYMDIGKNGASSFNVFQSDTEQYLQAKQEIINYIALAHQKLKFSYSIKDTAESTLAETFKQQAFLSEIGAPKVFVKDYRKISARVDDLVEYIDEGQVSTAQEKQTKLLIDMQALEVRTVRYNYLGQLDSDIAYIKKKRLAKYVPISHKQLLAARSHANAIITATPRASAEIKVAVKLAEFELAHLYHIAKEVNALKKTKSKYYEQYLLAKEALIHTVGESLAIADVRDLAMNKQVAAIALQAGTIKSKLTTAKAAVLALQSDSNQSSAATESLRAEFKSQLVNLDAKYDALVIENSALNKQLQRKDIDLVRLQAYKEAVLQIESKHAVEKELAVQVQATKEAEQKVLALKAKAQQEALALAAKVKLEAQQAALALQAQAKKEAEKKALALQAQAAVQTVPVSQTAEPVKAIATKLEVETPAVKVEVVEAVVEKPEKEKNNN